MRKVKLLLASSVLAVGIIPAAAPPAHACMGTVCDVINIVCSKTITKGEPCVK